MRGHHARGCSCLQRGPRRGGDRGQPEPQAARASVHPCSGPSARDGTAQPQGRRLPSSLASRHAALPGRRRPPQACALVRPCPPSARGGSGSGPCSPLLAERSGAAATPNSASCGCGRWRAVRQGERAVGAAAWHPAPPPLGLAAARGLRRPRLLPGHGNPRARPSPAAADLGPHPWPPRRRPHRTS